jgi:hypothetical protein
MSEQPKIIRTIAELNAELDKAVKNKKMVPAKTIKERPIQKKELKVSKPIKKGRGRKPVEIRVGEKKDFIGFGKGTKCGNIFECLLTGKYDKKMLEKKILSLHKNDSEIATIRTLNVFLSYMKNGKYPWTLINKKGKLFVK